MYELPRGANLLLNRKLYLADGTTPLAFAALASVWLSLSQNGKTVATLAPGSGALRAGSDGYSLDLELTSAFSATLTPATLEEKYTLKRANESFTAEPTYEVHVISLSEITVT